MTSVLKEALPQVSCVPLQTPPIQEVVRNSVWNYFYYCYQYFI